MSLTASTADYALSTDVLQMKDVYITSSGQTYLLDQVTPQELLRLRIGAGADTTGLTTCYAVRGSNLFMVYPTPATADTVTLYYVLRPTTMTTGTDTPTIPVEFHKAVEFYALSEAADYDDDQTSSQGQRYRERYLEEIRRYRRNITLKSGRAPAFRVNPRRRNMAPHDPSQDVY